VENGIHYNHPGGEVNVILSQEGAWAVIKVADTGIGIPPEEQRHIFGRFYRVDCSRSRHKGRAGLGLSIVAHIVHLHAGTIQVESTPGVGSTLCDCRCRLFPIFSLKLSPFASELNRDLTPDMVY
jgi:two-component system phosphate regulon sensor histidine kinase PhoR